ncbi:MAG: hypothetical protein ACOY9Y_10550 [Bacillota bacterium]
MQRPGRRKYTSKEDGWYQFGAYDEEDVLTSSLLPGLQISL